MKREAQSLGVTGWQSSGLRLRPEVRVEPRRCCGSRRDPGAEMNQCTWTKLIILACDDSPHGRIVIDGRRIPSPPDASTGIKAPWVSASFSHLQNVTTALMSSANSILVYGNCLYSPNFHIAFTGSLCDANALDATRSDQTLSTAWTCQSTSLSISISVSLVNLYHRGGQLIRDVKDIPDRNLSLI